MLAIRLQRIGRQGYPVYRVAVQESQRHPSSGRVVAPGAADVDVLVHMGAWHRTFYRAIQLVRLDARLVEADRPECCLAGSELLGVITQ